jgi:hypothetical protein
MKFFNDILTGPDNATLAIGRVLGALLFINLILVFPLFVGALLFLQKVEATVWFSYMDKLMVYVPAMVLSAWGLIRGTASVEMAR